MRMTTQEASEWLEYHKNNLIDEDTSAQIIEAVNVALKSLKSWRKVDVELSLQEQAHKDSKAIHTATGIRLAREIIKKYLGEVEEC